MLKPTCLPGLALGVLTAGTAVHGAPVTVPDFTYVKSVGGIDEYHLDANGLDVLIKPDHSLPVRRGLQAADLLDRVRRCERRLRA